MPLRCDDKLQVRVVPVTTGPRVTTLKVLSSLTRCSTSSARKLSVATVCRASSWRTH